MIDEDLIQRVKVGAIFILQLYKVIHDDIWITSPFNNEPLFFSAQKHLSAAGLYTTPRMVSFLNCNPIETAKMGRLWTKLVVPSRGSITHR